MLLLKSLSLDMSLETSLDLTICLSFEMSLDIGLRVLIGDSNRLYLGVSFLLTLNLDCELELLLIMPDFDSECCITDNLSPSVSSSVFSLVTSLFDGKHVKTSLLMDCCKLL